MPMPTTRRGRRPTDAPGRRLRDLRALRLIARGATVAEAAGAVGLTRGQLHRRLRALKAEVLDPDRPGADP